MFLLSSRDDLSAAISSLSAVTVSASLPVSSSNRGTSSSSSVLRLSCSFAAFKSACVVLRRVTQSATAASSLASAFSRSSSPSNFLPVSLSCDSTVSRVFMHPSASFALSSLSSLALFAFFFAVLSAFSVGTSSKSLAGLGCDLEPQTGQASPSLSFAARMPA